MSFTGCRIWRDKLSIQQETPISNCSSCVFGLLTYCFSSNAIKNRCRDFVLIFTIASGEDATSAAACRSFSKEYLQTLNHTVQENHDDVQFCSLRWFAEQIQTGLNLIWSHCCFSVGSLRRLQHAVLSRRSVDRGPTHCDQLGVSEPIDSDTGERGEKLTTDVDRRPA
jgi:hypothetical protein